MRRALIAVAALCGALNVTQAQSSTSVLFIGNSFTFAAGSPVQFYRADTVTDLNNEGIGGVPALFKSFTQQAGLAYEVSLETRGGSGLDFHLANKREVISSRAWDVVVMHGYSTLDSAKPRDPAKLIATSKEMADFLRARNPKVAAVLDGDLVSRRPDLSADGGLDRKANRGDGSRRSSRLRQGRSRRCGKAVIPVGEAWTRAMQTGVADPNPYDGIEAGKLDLWTYDHYHGSVYGYYLEALTIFGTLTGRDPRSLGDSECSAYELGLSRPQAKALQQVAFDQLAAADTVKAAPMVLDKPVNSVRCRAGRS